MPAADKQPLQRVIDSYHGTPCTYVRPEDCPIRPGEVCGVIHVHCVGHVKRKEPEHRRYLAYGDPCGALALTGQLVCRHHGGMAKQNRAAAEARLARQGAERVVGKLAANKGTKVTDPIDDLATLAGEAREWKRAADEMVAALTDPLVDTTTGKDVHPFVKLAERAKDSYGRLIVEMVKLGFVERRVQLEEASLAVTLAALEAVFLEAGLDPDRARRSLADKLLELDALEVAGHDEDEDEDDEEDGGDGPLVPA